MSETVKEKSEERSDAVIIRQQGMFYNCYDENAYILSGVTGYKARYTHSGRYKCGFPADSDKALEKVKKSLSEHQISVCIYRNSDLVFESAETNNEYSRFYSQAHDSLVKMKQDEADQAERDKVANVLSASEKNVKDLDLMEDVLDSYVVSVLLNEHIKDKLDDLSVKFPNYSYDALINYVLYKGIGAINNFLND